MIADMATPILKPRPGRPSLGVRRPVRFRVSQTLHDMLVRQAAAEGIDENQIINEIVAAHFPSWADRPAVTLDVARLLSRPGRGPYAYVRLPQPLGDAVYAQAESDRTDAAKIVAELLARHLPSPHTVEGPPPERGGP